MTRDQVLYEARTWLNTPYHHQGRIRGVGVDCAMLLIEVFHACGLIPNIDPRPYPPDWHFHRSEERYLGWVEQYAHQVAMPLPGDIALFQFGRCISHGAIVVEWPHVIHAYFSDGCILAHAEQGRMQGRVRSFYSLFERES